MPGFLSLQPEQTAYHSPPSAAEVNNVWSVISTPLHAFLT